MSSRYNIGQYLEWCTDLPIGDETRESPIFLLNGNKWFFRLVLEYNTSICCWRQMLYLELKSKHADLEPCVVKCEIGFLRETNLSFGKSEFKVSEHCLVWYIWLDDLQKMLPADYMTGNLMKFVFLFVGVTEPLLKFNEEAKSTSSEPKLLDSNFPLECLSQDFSKMLHDGLDHDVEIKSASGHTWKAHKIVLSARSKVLQDMLDTDVKVGHRRIIKLQDIGVPVTTIQHFLEYIYSGKLPEMSIETAKKLYELGNEYAVECLKKICANYLVDNLTPDNAYENLILAVRHDDSSFKESVIQFMAEKKDFLNDDLWRKFLQRNPRIAIEVYDRFIRRHVPKET